MRMSAEQAKYTERTYDQYANLYFHRIPYPCRPASNSLEWSRERQPAKSADPSAFVDASVLKSSEDSGFIKSLHE